MYLSQSVVCRKTQHSPASQSSESTTVTARTMLSLTQYKTPRKGSTLRTQELGCRSTGAPGKQWRGTGEGAHCGKLLLLLQRTWTPFSATTSWLKPFVTPASGDLTSRGTKYIFGVHSYIQAKHSRT